MKINVIWVIFNIKKFMKLEINSIIDKSEYKGKKVSKILSNDKKCIFRLIKEGFNFSDEVLEQAGIKKSIHSVSTICSIVEHDNSELTKKLEIDTIDATTLINELIIKDNPKLLTIDSDNDESVDDDFDDDFELSEEDI